MLRESGKAKNLTLDLAGAFDPAVDSGVEYGRELVVYANALTGIDPEGLRDARESLESRLGPDAVVTAAITAANFSMLDRAANAIGISVDSVIVKPSAGFRAQLGIDTYPSAANTLG